MSLGMFRKPLFHKSVAEAIGTFVLVFMGCGSVMISERFSGSIPPVAIPMVFGLAVSAMIYALGHISGAHFNPAVTLAFAIARHFPGKQVLAYWSAQFSGALFAIALLHLSLPPGESYGATVPALPWFQALIWEMALTFTLMFVIIAVATDTRAMGTMAGAAIGATVALGAFVGGPLTGASMNPARSLAPALAQGEAKVLWIYFLGPILGAALAALAYEWIRCEEKPAMAEPAKGCC